MILLCGTIFFVSLSFAANPYNEEHLARNPIIQELMERLQNLEDRIQRCETGIHNTPTNKSSTEQVHKRYLQDDLHDTSLESARVSFYAHLSKNLAGIGVHHTIIFDTVRYNDGNAYNKVDGEFTAKVPGTYFFIWTISASDRNTMETELVVNGVVFGHVIGDAANHDDWAESTGFVIVRLNINDVVWIRSGSINTGHVAGAGLGTSSFGGYLLYQ